MEDATRPQTALSQGKSSRKPAGCVRDLWEPVSIVGERRLSDCGCRGEKDRYPQRIRQMANSVTPMIEIKVIKNENDYREALKAIEALMVNDPDPESAEGEQLDLLSTLVADYESKLFPSTLPDPVEAIKFRMEQADLKPADLVPFIGSKSRVSEILSGKRKLT